SEKEARGGVTPIPQWFADSYTGGKNLGVGFGGYFSIISSPDSLGPALTAINAPSGPHRSSLPNVRLLGYDFGPPDSMHDREHAPPDYNSSYDNGAFNPTVINGVNTGYWTWSDEIYGGGTWIDLPNAAGVLFIGKIGKGNVWYETSDRHAQAGTVLWMIYD